MPRPDTPLDIVDEAWLRQQLGAAGRDVSGLALKAVTPVGHGTTSEVAQLTIEAQSGDWPDTLIAKVPRVSEEQDAAAAAIFGYAREAEAYRYFGIQPPFRIPRCYAAAGRDGGYNLVLEDLTDGCRAGNQIAGCSVGDARAVVRELAGLHGAYWRSPELDNLDWPNRRWRNADRSAGLFAKGAQAMRQRYAAELGDAVLDVIDAVVPLVKYWAAAQPIAPTLTHADPRVDNIIFEEAGGHLRACLIDLQSISIADGAYDLAYFLSGSLDPDARASCERELVSWHAAQMRLVAPDYDDDDAWQRYRQYAISGLIGTVGAAAMLADSPHVAQLLQVLARRNCAAVVALDGIAGARERIAEHNKSGRKA